MNSLSIIIVSILFLCIIVMFVKIIKHITKRDELFLNIVKEKDGEFIGFKKSLSRIHLPVITLSLYGSKFNFLIDSGSTRNYMAVDAIENLVNAGYDFTPISEGTASGIGGDLPTVEVVAPLRYAGYHFDTTIHLGDFGNAFDKVDDEEFRMHGILGNEFFQKYRWKFDFENKVVWIKP